SSPNSVYDGGDGYAYPAPFPAEDLISVLSSAADDPAPRSYASYILQNTFGGQSAGNYLDLLYRNPTAMTSPWSSEPLQQMAWGTGLLTARSDWSNNPNWIALQMGNLNVGGDHQPFTPGMMEINRGPDHLLINGNALSGNQNIYLQTGFSNALVI